jgi:hypothetical protein
MEKKEMKKFDMNGRVIVNAVLFREKNSNYFFLYLDEKLSENNIRFSLFDDLNSKNSSSGNDRKIMK